MSLDRTTVVLDAIGPTATRNDVVTPYANAIYESQYCTPPISTTDWPRVNKAIIDRWSMAGLEYIKRHAWGRADRAAKLGARIAQEPR